MTDNTTALTGLTLPALLQAQDNATVAFIAAKTTVAAVLQEINNRLGESAKQAYVQALKTHGTMSLPLQDGVTAKVDIKKSVTWDSAKLQELAQTLPWERVIAMFGIKFTMSETIYNGIAAFSPEMREKIDAARTVKMAEPAISLVMAS